MKGPFPAYRGTQSGKGTLKRPGIFSTVSLTLPTEVEEKPCQRKWQQLYGRQEFDEVQSFP